MLDDLLNLQIGGTTLAQILTLEWLLEVTGDVVFAILVIVAAFFVSGFVRRRIASISQRYQSIDKTLFSFLGNLARWTILAFAATFVLNRFGVQTASIVAVIGAAGLAIGLALQGTLSNIAAGVMMVLFRPIRVGDFVDVGGKLGTVQDINIMYIELATVGNVQIIIPNSDVWGAAITNYSIYPKRRAEWTFGVSYNSDLAEAERVIREVIGSDERTHSDPPIWCQVNALNDFSVDFLVRAWVDAASYWDYQADMKRRVKEALDQAGVEIPFPTRTVYERPDA
jgi:small conductance mechanosensitive channel